MPETKVSRTNSDGSVTEISRWEPERKGRRSIMAKDVKKATLAMVLHSAEDDGREYGDVFAKRAEELGYKTKAEKKVFCEGVLACLATEENEPVERLSTGTTNLVLQVEANHPNVWDRAMEAWEQGFWQAQ